jgi:hypothetical protein
MKCFWRRAAVIAAIGGLLAACGDEESQDQAAATSVNHPPVITGTASLTVMEGDAYEFVPKATDPDGDALIFHVSGKPKWMEFDSGTGRLSGTPKGQDRGKHRGIVVSVSDGQDEAILDPIDVEVIPADDGVNQRPQISGTPSPQVVVDSAYEFTPDASDPDGDSLSFDIANRPAWASFDSVTGALSGTPSVGDAGLYSSLSIAVSDGELNNTLGPFSIEVVASATGSALLSWLAPTENTDGSPLQDLAGYIVYWGTAPGDYTSSEVLSNPGISSLVVDNLLPGQTYFFTMTAYNSDGLESDFSNQASKSIL